MYLHVFAIYTYIIYTWSVDDPIPKIVDLSRYLYEGSSLCKHYAICLRKRLPIPQTSLK